MRTKNKLYIGHPINKKELSKTFNQCSYTVFIHMKKLNICFFSSYDELNINVHLKGNKISLLKGKLNLYLKGILINPLKAKNIYLKGVLLNALKGFIYLFSTINPQEDLFSIKFKYLKCLMVEIRKMNRQAQA